MGRSNRIMHVTMKRKLFLILTIAAMVGCQKNEIVEAPIEESGVSIIGTLPQTKTTFTDEGDVLKTEWVKDDALGFYWYKGGSIEGVGSGEVDKALNDRLIAESTGSKTTFKTSYYYMYEAKKDYLTYLYYPYNVNAGKDPLSVPLTVPSSQNQAGADDIVHLAATDFLYATTMANRPNGEAEQAVMVTFNHALSVLNIALTSAQSNYSVSDIKVRFEDESEIFSVSDGSVNLSDGSLTLTSGTPEISLQFKEAAKLSATPVKAYMTITPGHAGKTFSVYATVNGIETKLGSKKVPASGIPVGVKAALSFEVGEISTGHEYVDLSAGGTANCYLVTSPGFYKFKADVKGNGVVPSQLESVAGETAIAPKSALVLWYNTLQKSNNWVDESPVYVSSVSLDSDGYIRFYTPSVFVPGNVVIAAFAEEGVTYDSITTDENKCINNATLLWSWNIWAAEGYDPETSTITAGGKQFMNRLLGATISGMGTTGDYIPVGAVGNYYQWGRKDPFPAFSDYTVTIPTQYTNILFGTPTYTPIKALKIDGQSSKMNLDGQMFGYRTNESGSLDSGNAWNLMKRDDISSDKSTKNKVYVDYATVHPYKCITNNGDTFGGWRTWLNGDDPSYKSLWGESDLKKTLFDPCPAGWRVPSKDEATEFVNLAKAGNLASNLHGMEFQGNYFPITSSRDCAHFGTSYVLSVGVPVGSVFWTSDITGNFSCVYAASLNAPANFSDKYKKGEAIELESKVEAQNNANGNCVRCVKE